MPFAVAPLPGEALESWLAAIATRSSATWGEVLDTVLPIAPTGTRSAYRGGQLTAALRDDERVAITSATGIDAAHLDAMTLAGYRSPVITIDPDTRRARTPWGVIRRHRFCPLCMRSAPGRFPLRWLLPWMTACPEHRCLLADRCPQCDQMQYVAPCWFGTGTYPRPDRCRRWLPGVQTRTPCAAPLSGAPPDDLGADGWVLHYQRRVCELLTGATVGAGVYQRVPVSANQLLVDVGSLGGRILQSTTATDLLELTAGQTPHGQVGLWRDRLWPNDGGDHRQRIVIGTAASAATVGAGIAAALAILMQPSFTAAGAALHSAVRSQPPRPMHYLRDRHRVNPSPAVTAVELKAREDTFTVVELFRYRMMTDLPALSVRRRGARDTRILRAVPTLIWRDWALRLAPRPDNLNKSRQMFSRLVLAAGPLTQDVVREQLRWRGDIKRFNRALARLRDQQCWPGIATALLRLHDYLQEFPPPIDYQRRRQLRCEALLPVAQYADLTREVNIRFGAGCADAARKWLAERVSAMPVIDGTLSIATDRLLARLTPELAAGLDRIAVEFLHSNGIDGEPVTWTPPLDLLADLDLPGIAADAVAVEPLHALIAAGTPLPTIARRFGVSVFLVRHQIERHPIPASVPTRRPPVRPGVDRLPPARAWGRLAEHELRRLYLHEGFTFVEIAARVGVTKHAVGALARYYGIPSRESQRPVISRDWLYEQHVEQGRTWREIGDEVGLSANAVGLWARKYGIATRQLPRRHHPDPRAVALLKMLHLDVEGCPPRMKNGYAWRRAQRFAHAARHSTFAAAAAALGRSTDTLRYLIEELERDLDQQLIERAPAYRGSVTLTSYGRTVARAVERVQRTHGGDSITPLGPRIH